MKTINQANINEKNKRFAAWKTGESIKICWRSRGRKFNERHSTWFKIVRTTESDLERAAEILEKYNYNNIDLVDACIAVIAELLEIEKI